MNIHTTLARLCREILDHKRLSVIALMVLFVVGASWIGGDSLLQGNLVAKPKTQTMAERVAARAKSRKFKRTRTRMPFLGSFVTFVGNPPDLKPAASAFPAFGTAVFPVDRAPNWGAMRSPTEWNRSYAQMSDNDFVPVPAYDLSVLTIPMASLTNPVNDRTIPLITAKLFYSTRYFAAYSVDAGEFTGLHSGVDVKLPPGTPIRAIGGGIVRVADGEGPFGNHVMIEHRLKDGGTFFSLYGHCSSLSVRVGDTVFAGQVIGEVGSTGESTAPHLHIQVDKGDGSAEHTPYSPLYLPTREQAAKWSVNPMTFIKDHSVGDW